MKRLILATTLTATMTLSTNANAWWDGPFGGFGPWGNGWDDGWYGNGWFDFNMNMSFSGWGRGWGRGWDYYPYWSHPYWGGYPYYGYYSYWNTPYWSYPYAVAPQAPAEPTAPATSASK